MSELQDVETVIDIQKSEEEVFMCRICLQEEASSDFLISPCICSGSIKWVHADCLNHWRSTSTNSMASTNCLICRVPYVISQRPVHFFHNWCMQINYNVYFIFVLHQFITCAGSIVYFSITYTNKTHHFPSSTYSYSGLYISYLKTLGVTSFLLLSLVLYTFCRYAKRKLKICQKLCTYFIAGFPPGMCIILIVLFVMPQIEMFSALMGALMIDTFTCTIFKMIEKTNRRFNHDIVHNYEMN